MQNVIPGFPSGCFRLQLSSCPICSEYYHHYRIPFSSIWLQGKLKKIKRKKGRNWREKKSLVLPSKKRNTRMNRQSLWRLDWSIGRLDWSNGHLKSPLNFWGGCKQWFIVQQLLWLRTLNKAKNLSCTSSREGRAFGQNCIGECFERGLTKRWFDPDRIPMSS